MTYALDEGVYCLFEFVPTAPDFILHQVTVTKFTTDRSKQKSLTFELHFPWETPVVDSCREISSGSLQTRAFVIATPYIMIYSFGQSFFSSVQCVVTFSSFFTGKELKGELMNEAFEVAFSTSNFDNLFSQIERFFNHF